MAAKMMNLRLPETSVPQTNATMNCKLGSTRIGAGTKTTTIPVAVLVHEVLSIQVGQDEVGTVRGTLRQHHLHTPHHHILIRNEDTVPDPKKNKNAPSVVWT